MALNSLRDLYVEVLQELHDGEQQLTQALPELNSQVNSPELKSLLREHVEVSRRQAQRLEQVLQLVSQRPGGQQNRPLRQLVQEAQSAVGRGGSPGLADTLVVATSRKLQHLEIGGYQAALALARQLNQEDAVDQLQQSLEEEEQNDRRLAQVGEQLLRQEGGEVRRAA